ncbi:hypothetical protein ACWGET_20460 [Streptomyces zaomyceticus]
MPELPVRLIGARGSSAVGLSYRAAARRTGFNHGCSAGWWGLLPFGLPFVEQ